MVPNITPIMDNQMDKKMENEMEAGIESRRRTHHKAPPILRNNELNLLGLL